MTFRTNWADPSTERGQLEAIIDPIISGGARQASCDAVVDQLLAHTAKLRALVKQGEAVVEDFMPNIGKCVIQDFGRLNEFLIEAKKVKVP